MTPDDTSASVPREGGTTPETLRVVFYPAYDLTITPQEAVFFLSMSAVEFWASPCDDLHCEVCDDFTHSWHGLYRALDAVDRLAVENALEARNTRPPAFPQGLR